MTTRLVIYYSLEGNTELLAENIANAVEADIVRLTPLKELNPEKGSRFFWGGKQVFMKQAPPFEPLAINLEDYQMIFIGTPIWASSITPVIRSFLNRYKLHNKQIAVFWSSAGGKGEAYLYDPKTGSR